jgi:hypothetical protein
MSLEANLQQLPRETSKLVVWGNVGKNMVMSF